MYCITSVNPFRFAFMDIGKQLTNLKCHLQAKVFEIDFILILGMNKKVG
jgi:hypothetical protein